MRINTPQERRCKWHTLQFKLKSLAYMVETNDILCRILQIEHGFQHIIDGADQIFSAYSKEQCLDFAFEWFKSKDYQQPCWEN